MPETVMQSARPATVVAYDRVFYSAMSLTLAGTVFAGFASSYYVPLLGRGALVTLGGAPFTSLVHVHGALFTAWVMLFVVQTMLVAQRRVRVHRKLGVAGAVLAVGMVAAGTRLAIVAAARGGGPPGVDPLAFMIVPLTDMALFATFVAAALIRRRDRETHKRFMLLAYVSIVVAATARLPGVIPMGPPAFFGLAFLFVIAGAVYDLATRGRIHRVYLWGGGLFAISVPLRLVISSTDTWHAFASWLTR